MERSTLPFVDRFAFKNNQITFFAPILPSGKTGVGLPKTGLTEFTVKFSETADL